MSDINHLSEKALVFDSDVVFRIDNPYHYGLVGDLGWEREVDSEEEEEEEEEADMGNNLQGAGQHNDVEGEDDINLALDEDYEEDMENGEFEEDYEEEYEEDFELPLEYDEVEVDFGDETPEAVKHEQLQVYSRFFQPGNFCSTVEDRFGRAGMVINSRTMYDLVFEYHSKKKRLAKSKAFKRNILMPAVPGWRIQRIYNILHDDTYVATTDNTKVAMVLGETYRYYVALGPGVLMWFSEPDVALVEPIHEAGFKRVLRDEPYVYFPGQVVAVQRDAIKSSFCTFVQGSLLQAAKLWKRGQDTVRGVVVRVEPVTADVQLLTALDPAAMAAPVAELPCAQLRNLCPHAHLATMLHEVVHVPAEVRAAFPHFHACDDEREWRTVFDAYEDAWYVIGDLPPRLANHQILLYPWDPLEGAAPLRAEDVVLRGRDGRTGLVGAGLPADTVQAVVACLASVQGIISGAPAVPSQVPMEPSMGAKTGRVGPGELEEEPEEPEDAAEGGEKKVKSVEQMNLCWKYGCARVYRYRARVDVLWEDGSLQRDLPAAALVPRTDIGLEEHEHCAWDLVEERESASDGSPRRMGVVARVDNREKTCFVRFLHLLQDDDQADAPAAGHAAATAQPAPAPPAGRGGLGGLVEGDESVTLHHAVVASHGAPAPRDLVLRGIDPATSLTALRASEVPAGAEVLEDDTGRRYVCLAAEEVSAYSVRACEPIINVGDTVMRFLQEDAGDTLAEKAQKQWVGAVVSLVGGLVTVRWADASVTRVWHRELFVLNAEADDAAEEDATVAGEQGASPPSPALVAAEGDLIDPAADGGALAAGTNGSSAHVPLFGAAAVSAASLAPATPADAPVAMDAPVQPTAALPASGAVAAATRPVTPVTLVTPAFELLSTPPGSHQFLATPPAASPALAKRLRAEMRQLARDLPAGVFARTYADRMDLWSVLIVGPADTPYYGALFAFELRLPSAYPHEPPIAHHVSGGARVHPNLYEDGKICLSLLGTWNGKGSQNWSAEHSSLLQLCVSLQALVLGVAEPYYAEAGYESKRGSRAAALASLLYNEQAFLGAARMLAAAIARPVEPWAGLVAEHAQRMAARLHALLACQFAHKPQLPCARELARSSLRQATVTVAEGEGEGQGATEHADERAEDEQQLLEATHTALLTQRASLPAEVRVELALLAEYALPPRAEAGAWAAEVIVGELYFPSRGFVLQFKQIAQKLQDALGVARRDNHSM